jgi:hypothetical protein
MKKRILIIVLLLAFIFVIGCSKTIKSDDGTITLGKDGKIEVKDIEGKEVIKIEDNKMEIIMEDGQITSIVNAGDEKGTVLPQDYPKNVLPVIEGGIVEFYQRNENNRGKVSFWVSIKADKNLKEVYTYYQEVMKDAGDKNMFETSESASISGTKDENAVAVSIMVEEVNGSEKSIIHLTIEPADYLE